MELVLILRKEVEDETTAESLVTQIKNKLSDTQDLTIEAHTTRRYESQP